MAQCNLERAVGTDERVFVWVTTSADPTATEPQWSFTATNASSVGTLHTGEWDSAGWSEATGKTKCWSPLLTTDASLTADTYRVWIQVVVGDETPLVEPSNYLVLS